ncbi:DUF4113 domain-containing protein [bacterium]|nr:DUF4113 domain-containing protein [bacterium]
MDGTAEQRNWQMKSSYLSSNSTTSGEQIPTVKAK